MPWEKVGRIYKPDGSLWWAREYAHLPTVDVREDVVRVYFAGLDENKHGRIGFVDLNPGDLTRIEQISDKPVLDIGELGCFDDGGVNPTSLVTVNGARYLYYVGWQHCLRVPYLLQAGLAISVDGDNFKRASRATILPRSNDEPFFRSAMAVLYTEGRFRAWYPSAIAWESIRGALLPVYVIRHATSEDGIHWDAHSTISINFSNSDEHGFGRPFVRRDDMGYSMWYSIRSRSRPYRLGYATSEDGIHWHRLDELVGISVSGSGWDSEMICYGVVHSINDQQVLFYNGNQHGRSGFGCAVWRD